MEKSKPAPSASGKRSKSSVAVPWYRTPEAVAERKEKSRKLLLDDGGRELRAIRLDREANEAFEVVKAEHAELDNGGIVRLALVEIAQRILKKAKR